MGTTLVDDPETAIKGIEHLIKLSDGGFGGVMFRAHEWANREQTMRSYELFARYVAPHFQGSMKPCILQINLRAKTDLKWLAEMSRLYESIH